MAHDDDYDANDNDVHREGGARRKSKRRENEREKEREKERGNHQRVIFVIDYPAFH